MKKYRAERALAVAMIAMIATVATGCAESGLDEGAVVPEATETIGLYTSVNETRAVDIDNETLKGSYIDLYAYSSYYNEAKGPFTYSYDTSASAWSTSSENSTWGDVGFSTSFFTANDGSPVVLSGVSADSASLVYTVEGGDSSSTKDLVYFGSQVESLPVGGGIYADLEHALSKIHFTAATGTNNVYIAGIKVLHLDNSATLTISNDNTALWSDNDTDYDTDYTYRSTSAPTASVGDAVSLVTTDNALMIIPQSTSAYEQIVTDSDTYIEVIYYATDANGDPVVGYSSCSAYDGARLLDASMSGMESSDPLYVKVGFPLQYGFEAGVQYNISLGLGATDTTGGMILADSYVDYEGNEISLVDVGGGFVTPSLTVGEYVSGDGVGLIIDESSWDLDVPLDDAPEGDPTVALSGSGTESDPYEVYDVDAFNSIPYYDGVGVWFDIQVDSEDAETVTSCDLQGNICEYGSVHNVVVDCRGSEYSGLFTKVYDGEYIASFTIYEVTYTNVGRYFGALAGVSYRDIDYATTNCVLVKMSDSSISPAYRGGVVGVNYGIVDNACYKESEIEYDDEYIVGGIAAINLGEIFNCTVKDSEFEINKDVKVTIGGVVGVNYACVEYCNFESIFDISGTEDVVVGDVVVGGIVGKNLGGEVAISNVNGELYCSGDNVIMGGVVGENYADVSDCTNGGAMESNNDNVIIAGVVGKNYGEVYNVGNNGGVKSSNGYNVIMAGVVGENYGVVSNGTNGGGMECMDGEDVIMAGVVGENYGEVSGATNSAGIDFYGSNNAIIGGIVGKNYATTTDSNNSSPVYIYGGDDVVVGGVAGVNYASIDNSSMTADIVSLFGSNHYIGGVVGLMSSYDSLTPIVDNSAFSGSVTIESSDTYVAGVVGYIDSNGTTVSNCSAYEITTSDSYTWNQFYNAADGVTVTESGNSIYE